jgi:hypothetical protein
MRYNTNDKDELIKCCLSKIKDLGFELPDILSLEKVGANVLERSKFVTEHQHITHENALFHLLNKRIQA